jgi:predicted transcriptional regulator
MALVLPSTNVLKVVAMADIEFVRAELRARKGQWLRVAAESGVAHRAIYNVVYGKTDPRLSTVEKLTKWLEAAGHPADKGTAITATSDRRTEKVA